MVGNFKQALREVFVPGKGKENSEYGNSTQDKIKVLADKDQNNRQKEIKVPVRVQKEQQNKKDILNQVTSVYMETKKTTESGQTTTITKDTRIVGMITTESKLVVAGEVEGDIDCKDTVIVSGNVYGDIRCDSAEIDNAQIDGNINVSDRLQIKSDSKITGDLSGSDIEVSGCVKGNIDASQSVKLYTNACVEGNITSASISIETGAILQGSVNIQREEAQAS